MSSRKSFLISLIIVIGLSSLSFVLFYNSNKGLPDSTSRKESGQNKNFSAKSKKTFICEGRDVSNSEFLKNEPYPIEPSYETVDIAKKVKADIEQEGFVVESLTTPAEKSEQCPYIKFEVTLLKNDERFNQEYIVSVNSGKILQKIVITK